MHVGTVVDKDGDIADVAAEVRCSALPTQRAVCIMERAERLMRSEEAHGRCRPVLVPPHCCTTLVHPGISLQCKQLVYEAQAFSPLPEIQCISRLLPMPCATAWASAASRVGSLSKPLHGGHQTSLLQYGCRHRIPCHATQLPEAAGAQAEAVVPLVVACLSTLKLRVVRAQLSSSMAAKLKLLTRNSTGLWLPGHPFPSTRGAQWQLPWCSSPG